MQAASAATPRPYCKPRTIRIGNGEITLYDGLSNVESIVRNQNVCETRLANLRTGHLRASNLLQHETHCVFAAN